MYIRFQVYIFGLLAMAQLAGLRQPVRVRAPPLIWYGYEKEYPSEEGYSYLVTT